MAGGGWDGMGMGGELWWEWEWEWVGLGNGDAWARVRGWIESIKAIMMNS